MCDDDMISISLDLENRFLLNIFGTESKTLYLRCTAFICSELNGAVCENKIACQIYGVMNWNWVRGTEDRDDGGGNSHSDLRCASSGQRPARIVRNGYNTVPWTTPKTFSQNETSSS